MRGTAVDRGRSLHRKVGGQVRVHFVLGMHSGRERTEQDWRDLVGAQALRMVSPPSTASTAPVMYEAAGRSSDNVACATSSGSP
ncbi:MAG: hypothetical protein QOC69_5500 [Mycobacterium sp.]|nr:hypothetical protein [Mycobacterium sp.]